MTRGRHAGVLKPFYDLYRDGHMKPTEQGGAPTPESRGSSSPAPPPRSHAFVPVYLLDSETETVEQLQDEAQRLGAPPAAPGLALA